mmetsp:Transcript_5791/g.9620  ORF Transcript_5791/g.9620 Transcript_5791/m.9620 type:complete len:100 (-) Transcript_5791:244-543(-)
MCAYSQQGTSSWSKLMESGLVSVHSFVQFWKNMSCEHSKSRCRFLKEQRDYIGLMVTLLKLTLLLCFACLIDGYIGRLQIGGECDVSQCGISPLSKNMW